MKVEIFYPIVAMVMFLTKLFKSLKSKWNFIGLWIGLFMVKRELLWSVLEGICTKLRK